ncbi:MAG: CHRD domain-containing protein [Bacteroidota bacterium]|nr:CHRD domain-containing protein [Bacteroidota bacterium]
MKNLFSSLLLLAGLVAATACKKEDSTNNAPVQPTLGTFSGRQQVPVVTSAATGTITGTYDKAAMVLTYTVTFSGLSPVAGHLHLGAPGAMGGVFYPFPFNNATGDGYISPITGTKQLTVDQDKALLSRGVYANLHTKAYPNGEIRADMTVD